MSNLCERETGLAILDFEREVWDKVLGPALGDVPHVLILEGTWWRAQACEKRLARLDNVQELPFPDIFAGSFEGARVAYCCAYGAPRAVEPSQIFAQLGTPLIIQIGTCGVMTPGIPAGAVTVPRSAMARDGVSQYYGAGDSVDFDARWCARADTLLREANCTVLNTHHLTWPSLFAQSETICSGWAQEGLQTVDMEASAVAAVATRYGRASLAMLCTWDLLSDGRTFLDPLPDNSQAKLERANAATFETSLQLALEVARTGSG